ncbi:MAG TPA: MBL fold metallo-hydrolase [Bryobacteraceae bacterium]|nr:MBL fold metallo-hydrolase [Bryobacteraceae bacterium]
MRELMTLPRENISSQEHIADGVDRLKDLMVNVYAIGGRRGAWVLVDAGMPFSATLIRRWAERRFGAGTRPAAIVLTHGHFDHVGALRQLLQIWDVPVYAHPLEAPYLTGRSPYPPADPGVGGGAFSLLSPLFSRGPIEISRWLRPLPADGTVPGLDNWRWIHTPGHTAGHISLFRDDDRVLIAGDAFATTKQESLFAVATQRPELHGPPAFLTTDWEAAELSVQRLAGLIPNVIAAGHGTPMTGFGVAQALDEFAENFVDWARPVQGRYVRHPAVTDERGVVSLPPATSYPAMPAFLAGMAIAGTFWYLASRRRTS